MGKGFVELLSTTESTQIKGSIFANRIELEHVKKTKFELKLIKITDCFLDGHGQNTSNFVFIKIKSLYTNRLLYSKEFCQNQLVVQMI